MLSAIYTIIMTTKATLYLDSTLYKAFKHRAVETGQSVSSLVSDALQAQLAEDAQDIQTIRSRLTTKQKPVSYEAALKELQKNGVI